MKTRPPLVLLINPFIYDFAAFDCWAKPKGLLETGRIFRELGCEVGFVDCLDNRDREMADFARARPEIDFPKFKKYGTGGYFREEVDKPSNLTAIARRRFRFGLHPDLLRHRLSGLPRPDLIAVTGIMTYWWRGVRDTIAVARDIFPGIPVVLGGIYPSLLPDHAATHTGAEYIHTGRATTVSLGLALDRLGIGRPAPFPGRAGPLYFPYAEPPYGVLLLNEGCNRRCTYCASGLLRPEMIEYEPSAVFEEMRWLNLRGVRDFAFYDDFLLFGQEKRLLPLMARVLEELPPLRFHTPNGIHLRLLEQESARLMRESGFTTLRFGFETADRRLVRKTGFKIGINEFQQRIEALLKAGFDAGRIGIYCMLGLPGQTADQVAETIRFVKRCGVKPYLTEFSPIPGTPEYDKALAASPTDFGEDPELQSNTLLPLRDTHFTLEVVDELKSQCYGA